MGRERSSLVIQGSGQLELSRSITDQVSEDSSDSKRWLLSCKQSKLLLRKVIALGMCMGKGEGALEGTLVRHDTGTV